MIRRSTLIVAIVLALSGCTATEQLLSDAAMTTAIKSKLANAEGIGTLTDISVDTTDDLVTVSGTVADETERQRIAEIARKVAGDNKFVDALRVVGSPSAAPGGTTGQKK
jgi:hyperosmotically inducible protein